MCDRVTCGYLPAVQAPAVRAAPTRGSCTSRSANSARRSRVCRLIFVYEDPDGLLEIIDGVTRATRIAKLDPQQMVPVVVIGHYRRSRAASAAVKDRL